MTKEEAIESIKQRIEENDLCESDYVEIHRNILKIALTDAEPCEDAVSRETLLKILQTEIDMESKYISEQLTQDVPSGTVRDNGRLGRLQGINFVKNFVQSLPSVTPTNTVSEEVYTQEYLGRKDAEQKLYYLQRRTNMIRAKIKEHVLICQDQNVERVKALCWVLGMIDECEENEE